MNGVIGAYVHSTEVAHSWHSGMMGLTRWDVEHEGHIVRRGGWISTRCGFQGIPAARNGTVIQFLQLDRDWLWWVDTDMGFAPSTVDRLLDAADPELRPVMGALCVAQKMPAEDGMGGYETANVATIYDWISRGEAKGFIGRQDYPANQVIRCAGTGSACILIHRSVFERIRERYGEVWYVPVANPVVGGVVGEDLSFCLRCATLEIPIHVHTGVLTTHMKTVWLGESSLGRVEAACAT